MHFYMSHSSEYMSIQSPNSSHPLFPTHVYMSNLYICFSIPALQIGLSVPIF